MNERVKECMDVWMNEWMDGWMNGLLASVVFGCGGKCKQPKRRSGAFVFSFCYSFFLFLLFCSFPHSLQPTIIAISMKALSLLSTVGAVTAAGLLGYAVYFDYRRRNDPAFRKQLSRLPRWSWISSPSPIFYHSVINRHPLQLHSHFVCESIDSLSPLPSTPLRCHREAKGHGCQEKANGTKGKRSANGGMLEGRLGVGQERGLSLVYRGQGKILHGEFTAR